MNLFARLLSHGFALVVVALLAVGLIYRGELFPGMELPAFLAFDKTQQDEAASVAGTTSTDRPGPALTDQGMPAEAGQAAADIADQQVAAAKEAVAPAISPPPSAAPPPMPAPATESAGRTPAPVTPADREAMPGMMTGATDEAANETMTDTAAEAADEGADETMTDTAAEAAVEGADQATAEAAATQAVDTATAAAETATEGVGTTSAAADEMAAETGTATMAAPAGVAMPATQMATETTTPAAVETATATAGEATGATTPAEAGEPPAPADKGVAAAADIEPAGDLAAAAEEAEVMPPQVEVAKPAVRETSSTYRLLAAAREAYWLRDYATAEQNYQAMIEQDPDNPDGYGELGNMYFSQGKWDLAAGSYFEAGKRLADEGLLDEAGQLVDVLKGIQGPQAGELERYIAGKAPADQ
jgi:tetratricopeptide (TPR) repeat protein